MNKSENVVSTICVTIMHLNTFRPKALSRLQNVITHDIPQFRVPASCYSDRGFVDRIVFSSGMGEGV